VKIKMGKSMYFNVLLWLRKAANRMIKRNFANRSEETIYQLYKSLVRPHLAYCTQVWRPYLTKDIKLLEGVQRRTTKLVHGMADLKYDDRLKRLIRIKSFGHFGEQIAVMKLEGYSAGKCVINMCTQP